MRRALLGYLIERGGASTAIEACAALGISHRMRLAGPKPSARLKLHVEKSQAPLGSAHYAAERAETRLSIVLSCPSDRENLMSAELSVTRPTVPGKSRSIPSTRKVTLVPT